MVTVVSLIVAVIVVVRLWRGKGHRAAFTPGCTRGWGVVAVRAPVAAEATSVAEKKPVLVQSTALSIKMFSLGTSTL
jgi:hypothetical protein